MASMIDASLFVDSTMTTIIVNSAKSDESSTLINTRAGSQASVTDPTCNKSTNYGRKYIIHKALLCARLGYFKAAYNTKLREATENEFHIGDVDEKAFESLVKWVCTGQVCLDGGEVMLVERDDGEDLNLDKWNREDKEWDEDESEDEDEDDEDEKEEGGAELETEMDSDEEEWNEDGTEHKDFTEADLTKDFDVDAQGTLRLRKDVDVEENAPDSNDEGLSAEWREELEEGLMVQEVWPQTALTELDTYQLRVVLGVFEYDERAEKYRSKWQKLLAQKAELESQAPLSNKDEDNEPPSTYDRLIELYILADRFDSPLLRGQVFALLQTEHAEQRSLAGGTPLPSYETVARAYEAVPEGSALRAWLLNVYTCDWKFASVSEQMIAAMDVLPRDFLVRLLLARTSDTFGEMARVSFCEQFYEQRYRHAA